MLWFKHDSNANTDEKLQEVLLDYGLEGYGLYWYCLELIVNKIDEDNLTFQLKHDARIIARNTGSSVQKVEEMMKKFVSLGLFENDGGRITCLKLRKRLDKSMTSNSYIRNLITNLKVESKDYDGYVYFILAENETIKRIKIGRSKNPSARINDLKKRNDCIGLNLKILHTVKSDDCVSLETEMHRKFKHLNIKNEWFEHDEEILEFIYSIRSDSINLRTDYVLKEEKRIEEKRIEENRNIISKDILLHLNTILNSQYKPVKANLSLIDARLKEGYTKEEICQVIDKKFQEWKGTDFEKYLRPSTLFNATKFSSYYGQKSQSKTDSNKDWLKGCL